METNFTTPATILFRALPARPFPQLVRVTMKATGMSRIVGYDHPSSVIVMSTDVDVIEVMLSEYVDKEGSLDPKERLFFLFWAWSFVDLPSAVKAESNIEVEIVAREIAIV